MAAKGSEAEFGQGEQTDTEKRTRCEDLQGPGYLPAGSYHEVVELWRPGHELGFAFGHTDLHESSMLARLGLPHLTYYPVKETEPEARF